jgi:serine/threonine-protein kinase
MSDTLHGYQSENLEHEAFDAEFVASHTGPRNSDAPQRESGLVRAWRQLRPGDVVANKYRVERVIGQSGLASIAQVRHLVLEQQAVLKYLRPEARAFPETIANFLRGALLLSQMKNEHVASVLDVGMLELGTPYIVLEQPDGPDLAQVLRVRGPLPIPEAISYVAQVCDGIAQAHALGVTHGNLTPFNLFSVKREDGTPILRVGDFGSADVFDLSDMLAADVGFMPSRAMLESLRYLSPEHVRAPDTIDALTDVWALGAILHELLVGEPVYRDKTIPGLLAMIAADAPKSTRTLRPEVPGDLAAIVLRCLEKDRVARYANAGLLATALRTCRAAEAVPTVNISSGATPSTPAPEDIAKIQGRSLRPPPLPTIPPPQSRKSPTSGFAPALGYSIPPPQQQSSRSLWIAAAIVVPMLVGVLVFDIALRLSSRGTAEQSAQERAAALTPTPAEQAPLEPQNSAQKESEAPEATSTPESLAAASKAATELDLSSHPSSKPVVEPASTEQTIPTPTLKRRSKAKSSSSTLPERQLSEAVTAALKADNKEAKGSRDSADPFGSF